MKKLNFLFKDGLRKSILTKSFLISNIIIFILLIIMLCIPNLTARVVDESWYNRVYIVFEEDSTNNKNIEKMIAKDSILPKMSFRFDEPSAIIASEEEALRVAKEKKMHFLLYVEGSSDNENYVVKIHPIRASDIVPLLSYEIASLRKYEPSGDPGHGGETPPPPKPVEVEVKQDEKINKSNFNKAIMLSFLISMPLLLVIGRSSHYIGTSIVDEKISRGIENILSSVPAKTHLAGKVTSTLAYTSIQTLLIFVYATIGILISDTIKVHTHPGLSFIAIFSGNDAWLIVIMIFIAFMIAAMFFAIISALISALANKQEDFLVFQVPIQIISMIAFFLAVFSVMMSSVPTLKVLTYIPFFNAFAGPVGYVFGVVEWHHVMIGNLIAVVFIVLMFIFLRLLYKVSIMNVDSDKLPKRVYKALKLSLANHKKERKAKKDAKV